MIRIPLQMIIIGVFIALSLAPKGDERISLLKGIFTIVPLFFVHFA